MSTVATQGPVEARSLSSITAIASNPPAYPRNPTHEKHDPLVLYIVRVPGSQDIFLSPLKPPTKSSVSAEAINASLYYLHVATPDDDALLQEVEQEREEEAQRRREALEAAGADADDPSQREFLRMNKVRRKPVGGKDLDQENEGPLQQNSVPQALAELPAAPPPLPRRPIPTPEVSTENMSFTGTPVANAQHHHTNRLLPVVPSPNTPNIPPRRPLPSVPPTEEPWNQHPAGEVEPRKTNRWTAFTGNRGLEAWKERLEVLPAGRHSLDANRPPLPPRPTSQDRPGSANRSPGGSPHRQRRGPSGLANNSGFTITLIRRDPSSGTQWNVATIMAPNLDRNAIDIEIATPGYNRFTGSDEPLSLASLAANLPPGLIRTAGTAMPQPFPVEQVSEKPLGPRKFHRQVCVSKPFDDSNGTRHPSDLKSGYYVFKSPWNGTCTFSSSVNGRSLKCKHMISGPGHAPIGEGENPNPAVTVAEIRFNTPFQAANLHYHTSNRTHSLQTPTHNLPPSPDSPTHPNLATSKRNSFSTLLNPNTYSRPRAHSGPNAVVPENSRQPMSPAHILRRTSLRAQRFARQTQFQHHRRNASTSSDGADSDEDRLDLSLARELAGGGMRGKSAKLGKLIVEDEGIKMLDLVVAACMAVWWRGYYH
ncbi:hypothetical protein N7523_002365 [Penicillium sp. IBT 18751x]|nr:hypothetical protein N7523_002365 [Penicillium sp. IBT 18751x]